MAPYEEPVKRQEDKFDLSFTVGFNNYERILFILKWNKGFLKDFLDDIRDRDYIPNIAKKPLESEIKEKLETVIELLDRLDSTRHRNEY